MPQGNDYFSIRYSTSSTKKATTAIDFSNIPRYPHTKGEDSSKCRKSPTISVSFAYFLTLLNLHRSFFFLFPFPLRQSTKMSTIIDRKRLLLCPFYGIPPLPHEGILPSQLTLLFFGPSKEIQTIYLKSYTFHGRRKTSKKMFSLKTLQF